jgi:hypothetical protein
VIVGNEGQQNINRATKLILRGEVSNLILSQPGTFWQLLKNIYRFEKLFVLFVS